MTSKITQADLEAYLDESLPAEVTAQIEEALRSDDALMEKLATINQRRNAGIHSVGEIWRQHRISCPSRQDLGGFLLQTLAPDYAAFIQFHIEITGCRFCQANLEDLKSDTIEDESDRSTRRKKYIDSSAGRLKDIS